VLKIITVGSQAIRLYPVVSLLSENNLLLFFHPSPFPIELCLLFHPLSVPCLDQLLVFPAVL
jgi:hypothetical protein